MRANNVKLPTVQSTVGMCALLFLRLRMVGNNQKHQVTRGGGRSENLWGQGGGQGVINTKPFDSTSFTSTSAPMKGGHSVLNWR